MAASGTWLWVADARSASATAAWSRARAALDRARRSPAGLWAPEHLEATHALLNRGEGERARQRGRWLLPDYAAAEALWADAASEASQAETLGEARRAAARDVARQRLAVAETTVASARNLPPGLRAGANPQRILARAQARLVEARIRLRDDDIVAAATAASDATELAGRLDGHVGALSARYDDAAQLQTWRRWKAEAIAWSRRERQPAVVVSKADHRLTVYVDGQPAGDFVVDLGFNWLPAKRVAGDGATPEGHYRVSQVRKGAATLYYKALFLDYPNSADRRLFGERLRAGDVPAGSGIGGAIEIHGLGGRGDDWTEGCVALSNADMDRLLRLVGVGARVTIIGAEQPGAIETFVTAAARGLRSSGASR